MAAQSRPTFGRVIQILHDLGFVDEPAADGVLALVHRDSGAEFLFRERDAETPARVTELVNLRVQLTLRGLLTEMELEALLAPTTQPTPSTPQ